MTYMDGPSHKRRRVRITRRPNPGKEPTSELKKLIEAVAEAHPRLTPQEIKAVLEHGGTEITVDEIIWVKNQK